MKYRPGNTIWGYPLYFEFRPMVIGCAIHLIGFGRQLFRLVSDLRRGSFPNIRLNIPRLDYGYGNVPW
jgi:hypothetical protein